MILCNYCGKRIQRGKEITNAPLLDRVGYFFFGEPRDNIKKPVENIHEIIHLHPECQTEVEKKMAKYWSELMIDQKTYEGGEECQK